ncbi:putative kinase [Flavobacterium sp. 2755]|uniref:P-loop NTPase fold protein n=1 Tax=Flavobacterium sp. 2755 TaxID=2817765 RepID=UPI002854A11C|nr:P-loop NTPase fold protein [Flavobacterium sp. 2755]MDR6763804.1 putative kinase [Flavobacterium sp. 2755]
MFFFFDINNSQTKIGSSPKEADIAIVSIDMNANIGQLNQLVLDEYGYKKTILKQLNLAKGFDLYQLNGKPILFIVTVGIGNPVNNLNVNLRQAITFNWEILSNKKIWIPLMATGVGRVSYQESYEVTISILKDLETYIQKFNCQFIISIPNDKDGNDLYKKIEESSKNYHSGIKPDNINIGGSIDPTQLKELQDLRDGVISSNEKEEKKQLKQNITTLPGILSDSDKGVDHLNIKEDYEAFARVIAAKNFVPPLAIALLGKWGSGKSFFMHKLKEEIQYLSLKNPQKAFCEGIAHVHFNAWSYMDSNLWASIVTRIFEGLQEYITSDTKAKNFKKEIEKKLTQNLNFSKEEIKSLEQQSQIIRVQLFGLYRQKIVAKKELKLKINTIKQNTLKKVLKNVNEKFTVKSTIENSLNENPTFIKSTDELKQIIPEKYWVSPNELYNQTKSKYTFFKVFFENDKWLKNTSYLLAILAIIFFTPIFSSLTSLLISWQDFSFSAKTVSFLLIFGNFWKRAIDTYNKLHPLIASFWNLKTNYEIEKADAIFKFKQREKALKLEIKNSKENINIINQRLSDILEIKSRLEFKLNNALSTEALYTFIEKRANSDDYKKHLGIVSTIRKDFEILSDLLTDHNIETEENKESEDFKKMFNKPLQRIILYIDDLDRCPEDRVVEVLEAVNLLMAFPLFIVVVGVDPRWVKTALNHKYEKLFSGSDPNDDKISASNYLEKIFQVPFHIKDADDINIKNMIEKLAQIKTTDKIAKTTETVDKNIKKPNVGNSKPLNNSFEIRNLDDSNGSLNLENEEIDSLDILPEEILQIKSLTKIIGKNPRCIKRFINIYRIIKTHKDFSYKEENKENELLIAMFFLALSIGEFKNLVKSFEYFLDNAVDKKLHISEYFENTHVFELSNELLLQKNELKILLSEKGNNLLKQEASLSRKHYQFIKRFTFKNI